MCPYISGARQCPCCGGWDIPDNAVAIYIPDKRKYKKQIQKYCYVMDAIAQGMEIHESLSLVSEEECKTIVSDLRTKNLLILKCGCPNESLDYRDYMLAFSGNRENETAKEKSAVIVEILKTVQATAQVALLLGSKS